MEPDWSTPHHRKRKRRRAPERPAIPAELTLDRTLQGDIALISEDLFCDLFPTTANSTSKTNGSSNYETEAYARYAAIQCHIPGSIPRPDCGKWTIIQVKVVATTSSSKPISQSSVRISPANSAIHHLLSVQPHDFTRNLAVHDSGPIKINVLDVSPVTLDTIVVITNGAGPGKDTVPKNAHSEDVWVQKIKNALGSTAIVRSGDFLGLPSKANGESEILVLIEFCEPVSQGLLSEWTKVVVVSASKRGLPSGSLAQSAISNGSLQDQGDTSVEEFYSAAEDIAPTPTPLRTTGLHDVSEAPKDHERGLNLEESDESTDVDLSDSDTRAVGLSLPSLPGQAGGLLSDIEPATSTRDSSMYNGTSSPGSAISSYSTATVRPGRHRAKLFMTQELSSRIPDECLLPKPLSDEEDEEARIYTDINALIKLGCSSGDWVGIDATIDTSLDGASPWETGYFNPNVEESQNWRAVKIYALPNSSRQKQRYFFDKKNRRTSSASHSYLERSALLVHMPPFLLANIGNPSAVRIYPLETRSLRNTRNGQMSKPLNSSKSMPPFAREAEIHRLCTPVSMERYIQPSLFQGLRRYFAVRRRIVKTGDLIGFAIDDDLGRATFEGSLGKDDLEQDDLLAKNDLVLKRNDHITTKVAWFKVGRLVVEVTDADEADIWGGAVSIRSDITRLAQTITEYGKVPPAIRNSWPSYIGTRRPRISQNGRLDFGLSNDSILPYISETRRRLRELISVATSPQAIHFRMPPAAVLLTSTQKHIGKATAATNASADLGLHIFTIDAFDILSEGGAGGGDVNTAGFLEARAERAMTCGAEYTVLVIKHIDALTADRMARSLEKIMTICRVLIATTSDVEKVHESVRSLFVHELQISAPDEKEREGLLRDIVRSSGILVASDVDLSSVALKTAALVAGDLVDVVDRAIIARDERLDKLAVSLSSRKAPSNERAIIRDLQLAGGDASRCVVKADFDVAVDAARKNFADAIGAPKIPNVTWDDVGGLSNVKDAVMETIQLPLERPELFAKGMKKRSGILFYGPPGTGKTLLAKAIATEFSLNFFSVKGPEMLNMYIGESEANVRRVFQRARDARPCVVFFDELDSVAPRRGKSGDSQGVMDRIVSQLLAELDGMSDGEGGGVFVIGATNRPDLLDQALLRPGRFDKMLYLGVSDTHEKQLTILEALTRKFTLHPDLTLSTVASSLSFTYTGADLYALCSDAMLKAITRRATSVDNQVRDINNKRAMSTLPLPPITVAYFFDHLATSTDTEVVVGLEDFQSAIRELVPSVSVKELEHYNRVREEFEKGEEKKDAQTPREEIVASIKSLHEKMSWGNGDTRYERPAHEDDYILRTGGLTLEDSPNGNGANGVTWDGTDHGMPNGKGKGKGKAAWNGKGKGKQVEDSTPNGFGDAAEGDEDMYSS